MVNRSGLDQQIDAPLYNSRLIKNYVEYVKKFHSEIDIEPVLEYAWITSYELEDQGHWFSQWQVDRFHERLTERTGDSNISRKVGRFVASSEASGALKHYTLGFMSPAAAYWVLEKIAPHLTRASTLKVRKLGPSKIEVTVIPKDAVTEKPYQCENRMGQLEALSKLFTNKFARIEHLTCVHRGGDLCRYVITWEQTQGFILRRVRTGLILSGLILGGSLYLLDFPMAGITSILLFSSLVMGVSFASERREREELARNIESQRDAAKLLLEQINIRYNDAQLVKEIGQATSMFLDIQRLLRAVMEAMEKRLDFDRGGLWLANKDKTRLVYHMGYGYKAEVEEILRRTSFRLDNPHSKGMAVLAFRQKKPFLINDVTRIEKELSPRSSEFLKQTGAKSFICVPVVYEREALGVLFVDNIRSRTPLSHSDMSLLMGIAPQIAVSIRNVMSYQRLRESELREHNLRKLFEKYVPAPVIKRYVDSEDVDLFRGEESAITALFLDMRGFTTSSETMEARDVVSFLNHYFDKCSVVISEENGHINKYTGDGFLAIFGAPEPFEHHATMAFNAACKILSLTRDITLQGGPMSIGIGIHTGRAIQGNIGSRTKIEYTAIGDTINTAARLQEFSKLFRRFPIIMSRAVYEELSGHPDCKGIKNLGKQNIRGKKEKLEAFGYSPLVGEIPSKIYRLEGDVPLQRIKGV